MSDQRSKTIKNIKRYGTLAGASVLLLTTIIGSGFGYASAVKNPNKGSIDTMFNQRMLIESEIKLEDGVTIEDASAYANETIDFLGLNNSSVWISDSEDKDKLVIDTPVSSISKAFRENDDKDKTINDIMADPANNKELVSEVVKIYMTSFFNSNLDFRNLEGESLFTKTGHGYSFNNNLSTGDTGTETAIFQTTRSSSYKDYDFYNKASVSYNNGTPVINISLQEPYGNDDVINMFKDFNNSIDPTSETPQYAIWFGYDQIVEIVNEADPSSTTNLYGDYISDNNGEAPTWLKPFFVSATNTKILKDKYQDKITIAVPGMTDSQAKFFARKINNANSFTTDLDSIKTTIYTDPKSNVILIVMASLLLVFIVAVIFLFSWYFGLLGVIASSMFVLINMITGILFAAIGLTISVTSLIALFLVVIFSSLILFKVTNDYKNDNKDKHTTIGKRYIEKLTKFNRESFSPMVVMTLIIFVAGMLAPAIIASSLYVIIIASTLSYVFALGLQLLYLLVDLIINFTGTQYNVKWSLMVGRIDKIVIKNNFNNYSLNKGKALINSGISLIVIAIGLLTGGLLFGLTGSAVNSNMYGTQDYYYGVELVNNDNASFNLSDESSASKFGNEYLQEAFDTTNTLRKDVKKAFNNSGVKASTVTTVRNDEIKYDTSYTSGVWNDGIVDTTEFGFIVTSTKKVDSEDIAKINTELNKINTGIQGENGFELNEGGLELMTEKLSLGYNNQVGRIVNKTDNKVAMNAIIMVLIIILVFGLLMIVIGKWGAALAVMISTLAEGGLIMAPIFALFIPFTQIMLFVVAIAMAISAAMKTLVIKAMQDEENKSELNWIKQNGKYELTILIIMSIIGLLSWFFIPAVGIVSTIMVIVIALWSAVVIFFTQRYLFLYLTKNLITYAKDSKERRMMKDQQNSIDTNEPTEEYIEGINK